MIRVAFHWSRRASGLACLLLVTWLPGLVQLAVAAVPPAAGDPAGAATHPRIIRSAWIADPGDAFSPRQVLSQAWTPYSGALARGYTEDTTWIRLTIDPAVDARSAEGQRLALFIEPQQLDQVSIYLPGQFERPLAVVGDTVPPVPGQLPRLAHVVALPDAAEPFEVLLRVRNRSTSLVSLRVLRWDDAVARDTRQLLTVTAFLVFDLVVAIAAGLAWLGRRDVVMGLYIAHQLVAFLLISTLQGLVRTWTVPWLFTPGIVDTLTSAMVPVYAGVTFFLSIHLLRDFGAREPERRWLPLGLVPSVLGALLMVLEFRQLGLQVTNAAVPLLMLGLMLVAWRCRPAGSGQGHGSGTWRRAGMAGAYALMAVLTVPQWLRVLGILSDGSSSYNFPMYYAFVMTLIMAGLLRVRAADLERYRREMAEALETARYAARLQQERAKEQSELLTLLAHELKTPLSVVSLALDEGGTSSVTRGASGRAIRAMRDVIDRCTQIAYFDQDAMHAGLEVMPALIDPGHAVAAAVALQAESARVDIVATTGSTACHTDRRLLEIILGNLLDNALKYSPPEARVELTVATAERNDRPGILFRISNPPGRARRPDPEKLFRKYYRSSHAQYSSGSGLGLYLSKRLAVRLRGQLELVEGENVTFELWIPLYYS